MNRKVMVYFIGLVWVAVLLQVAVIVGMRNDKKAVQAFQSVNSVPVKSQVMVTGVYKKYLVTKEEKENLGRFVMKHLGVKNYQTDEKKEQECRQIVWTANTDTAVVKTVFQEEMQNQAVTVVVTLKEEMDHLIEVKENIEEAFQELNMQAETSFYIEGKMEGRMSAVQMQQCKNEMFKVLETKSVKQQNVSGARIYYGFSRRLSNIKKIQDEKMNVQLAFVYDEENVQTKIYLGVPFFNGNF